MLGKRCNAELSISPLFTRSFSRWSEDGLYLYDSPHSVLLGSALNIKVPFPSLWLTVTEWMLAFYPVPVIDVGAPPSYLGLWLYLLHSLTLTRWESWEGRWRSLSLFTNWHWPCMLTGSPGQHSSPKIKGSSCLSSSLPRQRSRKPCQGNSETSHKDAKVWSQLPPSLDSL